MRLPCSRSMSTTVQSWRGAIRWPAYRRCCSSATARWLRGAWGNSATAILRIGSRVCWQGTDLLREEEIDSPQTEAHEGGSSAIASARARQLLADSAAK